MTAQQLKNSILQLAVQGKLVPQDPNDEPASLLLEKIRAEKQKLIKEGKIKKDKKESVIYRAPREGDDSTDNLPYAFYEKTADGAAREITDELPFEIPESWEWVRLGELVTVKGGKRIPKGRKLLEIPTKHIYIRVTDMKDNTLITDNLRYIDNTIFSQIKNYTIGKDDLYLTIAGTIGNVGSVPNLFDGMNLTENAAKLTYLQIEKIFLLYALQSPFIQEQFIDKTNQVAQPKLAIERINTTIFPLPPLVEQQRIVEHIEKLLPHVTAYDVAEQKLIALNAMFPNALKKSILQAAVQGKLVPQDPADEPANVLLERIRAEKEALIKVGKIKRDRHESVIFRRDNSHYEIREGVEVCIEDELPFDIPESWVWARLGTIGITNIGLTYSPADVTDTQGIPVLRSNNIQNGKITYDNLIRVNVEVSEKLMVSEGDILICARNGSRALVGKSALIEKGGMTFGAFMAIYRSVCNPYIQMFINSTLFREQLEGANTTTINQVTQDMLKQSLCPLPPLSEQRRIVQRYKELLPLIESCIGS